MLGLTAMPCIYMEPVLLSVKVSHHHMRAPSVLSCNAMIVWSGADSVQMVEGAGICSLSHALPESVIGSSAHPGLVPWASLTRKVQGQALHLAGRSRPG